MAENKSIQTSKEAKEALLSGNKAYMDMRKEGDISAERRENTAVNGQSPYAVVVACSDSRVPVEYIFNAGVGDLFIIRTAGNVIGDYELGSIEYGVEHLGVKLVVVMGHTGCGAVQAAIEGDAAGHIQCILDEIHTAIGEEKNNSLAENMNLKNSIHRIKESAIIREFIEHENVEIAGAKYDIKTGAVSFLD